MTTKTEIPNKEYPRKVNAVIMFADIVGSSKIAENADIDSYCTMIREYHWITEKALTEYCASENILPEHCEKRAYGDEIALFLYSGDVLTDLKDALYAAVLLRNKWVKSDYNRARKEEGKTYTEIRVGISD